VARCGYCKSETVLFDRGVPVCLDCATRLETKPRPSAAKDSLTRLQRELKEATARAHQATDAFNAIMGDIPSSVPQPDGTQRINNVYRELSLARREMMRAHSRLTHFLDTGAIPEDLE
jgi:hypothetical protein